MIEDTRTLKTLSYYVEFKSNFKLNIPFATIFFQRGTLQAVEIVKWKIGNSAPCIPACAQCIDRLPGLCWKNTRPGGGRAEREWCFGEKKKIY